MKDWFGSSIVILRNEVYRSSQPVIVFWEGLFVIVDL